LLDITHAKGVFYSRLSPVMKCEVTDTPTTVVMKCHGEFASSRK